jgi:membrane protease YdiL (CAAX protease family)
MEEVLFRGAIQRSLAERFGALRSVLAASAIFALVHIIPQQMVNAFFVGIILGYIYVKTQSLLPVMIIHALNNAMAFVQMKIFGTDSMVTVRELVGNDTTYWIVYGLLGAIFVWAMLKLWRQLKAIPAVEKK